MHVVDSHSQSITTLEFQLG